MIERRYHTVEVRENENKIVGTASVNYNGSSQTEFELWPNVFERVMPGAFDNVTNQDVVALFNHDPNLVLGRTPNTLKIWTDATGLRYEILPDTTTIAQDVAKMIRRGDVRGSSFAFTVNKERWIEEGNRHIRELHSVNLHDVSPVTRPAYEGTSVKLRSQELREIRDSYDNWRAFVETQKRIAKLEQLKISM